MQVISIHYDLKEELYNILTHGFAFLLSIAALAVLVVFASLEGTAWHIVSFSIFGASLVVLYFASTVFHMTTDEQRRKRLKVFDHAAIFLLIAGTYTPFTLVVLNGPWGWSIFGVVWGMAVGGIVLKLFYTGRFTRLSTILYVAMGWTIMVAIYPLYLAFSGAGMLWLIAGGVSYTIGAVLFLKENIPYNHVIFHLLVILGSLCHFVSIFWYVL
jgi:hemolysin III